MTTKSFCASFKRFIHPKVDHDIFLSLLIYKTYYDSPLIESITFTCLNNELSISNLKIKDDASIIDISYTKSLLNHTLEYFDHHYHVFKDQEINYNRIEQETIHLNFQEEYRNKIKDILMKLEFIKNFKTDNCKITTYYLNDDPEVFSFALGYYNNDYKKIELSDKHQIRFMELNIKESQIEELNHQLQALFNITANGVRRFPKTLSPTYFQTYPIVFTRD